MKLLSLFFLFAIIVTTPDSLAQQKALSSDTVSGRFQIVVVEKLDKTQWTPQSNYFPETATGEQHNYLLLDTQTGRTWILAPISSKRAGSDGKDVYAVSYAWKPLSFMTDVELPWTKGLSRKPD